MLRLLRVRQVPRQLVRQYESKQVTKFDQLFVGLNEYFCKEGFYVATNTSQRVNCAV